MMEPKPPPSRMARYSSKSASSFSLVAPPEKMTMRRPGEGRLHHVAHAVGQRVDLARAAFSYAFLASGCSMCWVGGLTLMTCAPSCAAICAA